MSGIESSQEEKINGFSKWEIQDAARTLIRAEEIRNDKRQKFFDTVKEELKRQAQAAAEAAIENKVGKNLTKTFGKRD